MGSKKLGISILLVILIYVLYQILPWFFLYLSVKNQPDPPPPLITESEFPIKIEYEVNGKTEVLEDSIICEFGGYKKIAIGDNKKIWNAYLKSGNKRITLLKISKNEEIYYEYDSPEYYMNDLRTQSIERYESFSEEIYYAKFDENNMCVDYKMLSEEELSSKYSIKIKNFEKSKPLG